MLCFTLRQPHIPRFLAVTLLFVFVLMPAAAESDQKIILHLRLAQLDPQAEPKLDTSLVMTGESPGALRVAPFRPGVNAAEVIRALGDQGTLRLLGEPQLAAMDGQEVTFVSGGDFPYPDVQHSISGIATVIIKFKEYGIRLQFVPQITSAGTLRLRVTPLSQRVGLGARCGSSRDARSQCRGAAHASRRRIGQWPGHRDFRLG